jgi:signal transduction histidine kinase
MNSLRVKLVMLLVVAIVSVVGLLTGMMLYLLGPPGPGRSVNPVAEQVEMLARAAVHGAAALAIAPQPSSGREMRATTSGLREALAARGVDLDVIVSRSGPQAATVVSIPIEGRGWLLMPLPDLPPPDGGGWDVLIGWLALLTFGATAIAIFAVNRMVKPLVMLESAVASVGPEGILPLLPERGPAEVRATAKALNSLSSRLKSAIESRMRLVAAAGHDLRTPITRMRLRAEFVENEEDRGLWLRDMEELERIADSAIQLVREEAGKAEPELLRIDELVSDIVEELKTHGYNISVTKLEPARVSASRLALARALRNLMINAATHGVGAHVAVTQQSDRALVTIDDEGPGIPENLMGQVFEPFFRADPARRQATPGAGLGLTIAREIIQRAGGSVRIGNRATGGLAQVVDLPTA